MPRQVLLSYQQIDENAIEIIYELLHLCNIDGLTTPEQRVVQRYVYYHIFNKLIGEGKHKATECVATGLMVEYTPKDELDIDEE